MPDWLKPYEPYFSDTGALGVETLMNTYGAKCVARIAQGHGEDAVQLRAILANTQVRLLTALKGAGLLKDVPACPLPEASKETPGGQ